MSRYNPVDRVKLAEQEKLLLRLMIKAGEPQLGPQLLEAAKGNISGQSVYLYLTSLKNRKMIDSARNPSGATTPKYIYSLTELGRTYHDEYLRPKSKSDSDSTASPQSVPETT